MSQTTTVSFRPDGYECGGRWARSAVGLLALQIAVGGVMLYLENATLQAAHSMAVAARYPVAPELIDRYAAAAGPLWLLYCLQTALVLVTLVPFLVWVYRTHRNASALGARRDSPKPAWAVAYFLIPVVNLATPYRVMWTTWRASIPAARGSRSARRIALGGVLLIGGWWLAFAASTLLTAAAAGTVCEALAETRGDAMVVQHMQSLALLSMAATAAAVLSYLLTILVIAGLERLQRARFAMLTPTCGEDGANSAARAITEVFILEATP